jgi:ParB family chromosome partitioning protein
MNHLILMLLKNGEERLLVAVEKGRIPLNAALTVDFSPILTQGFH